MFLIFGVNTVSRINFKSSIHDRLFFNSVFSSMYIFNVDLMKKYEDLGVVTIGDFLEKSPLWSRRDKVRLLVAFIDRAIFAVWPHGIRLNDEQSVFVDFTNAITVRAINLAMIKRITFKPVKVWERWHEDLQMDGLEELWPSIVNIHFQFLQVKHQTFYWRYLYRGYVTNKMLFKANLHSNDRCSFCDREVETFKHLYWDCNC